jgi:hypothetical protein
MWDKSHTIKWCNTIGGSNEYQKIFKKHMPSSAIADISDDGVGGVWGH